MSTTIAANNSKVIVDYSDLPKKLMISGNYDFIDEAVSSNINNFKVSSHTDKKIIRPVRMFHTKKVSSMSMITYQLREKKLRHAFVEELLTFGAMFPDSQRQYSIVAMNATCNIEGAKHALCLIGNKNMRGLSLVPLVIKKIWHPDCRFLAFDLDY